MKTQIVNGNSVTVEGDRIRIGTFKIIPIELASIAASKDAWMRQILVPCKECKADFTIQELFEECPFNCIECSEKYYATLYK